MAHNAPCALHAATNFTICTAQSALRTQSSRQTADGRPSATPSRLALQAPLSCQRAACELASTPRHEAPLSGGQARVQMQLGLGLGLPVPPTMQLQLQQAPQRMREKSEAKRKKRRSIDWPRQTNQLHTNSLGGAHLAPSAGLRLARATLSAGRCCFWPPAEALDNFTTGKCVLFTFSNSISALAGETNFFLDLWPRKPVGLSAHSRHTSLPSGSNGVGVRPPLQPSCNFVCGRHTVCRVCLQCAAQLAPTGTNWAPPETGGKQTEKTQAGQEKGRDMEWRVVCVFVCVYLCVKRGQNGAEMGPRCTLRMAPLGLLIF